MSKYKVGDKVRIVSEWGEGCYQNGDGLMDKWLGKVMTIKEISCFGNYAMEEDQNEGNFGDGWRWNDDCIAGLACKFNVGERYKVVGGLSDSGNIIEITGCDTLWGFNNYTYKTIVGKEPFTDKFDEGSPFADNLIPYTEENVKIIIIRDGRKVTARKYVDEQLVNSAVARCAPDDAFDFDTGARIAIHRLLNIEELSQIEQTNIFDGLTYEEVVKLIDKMTNLVTEIGKLHG